MQSSIMSRPPGQYVRVAEGEEVLGATLTKPESYELVRDHLRAAADEVPTQPFVTIVGAPSVTYREMEVRARRLSSAMADTDIVAGDRVAVLLNNGIEVLEVIFACHIGGQIVVPLNTALRGESLEAALDLVEPKLVFVDAELNAELCETLETYPTAKIVVVETPTAPLPAGAETYTAFAARGCEKYEYPTLDAHEPSAIVLTSGTTGPSKGTVYTNKSTLDSSGSFRRYTGLDETDVVYTCLPVFHTNALHLSVLGALLARCHVVVGRRFSVSSFWREVTDCRATVTNLLGVMADLLLRREASAEERNHSLRYALVIPASPEVHVSMQARFGLTPVEAYGLSDFGMVLWPPQQSSAPPGSCGRAIDGIEVQIVDGAGREVKSGEVGELLVRPTLGGPTPPLGYWRNDAATVASRQGFWHHSGDLFRRDDDGWYYFAGRVKESIRRRGENVSAYEVEKAALRHPAVAECAAYPLPSDFSEDEVAIAVVLTGGAHLSPSELVDFLRPDLPYFSVPRYVTVLPELPKTLTMKVRRAELVERGIDGVDFDAGDPRDRDKPIARGAAEG